MHCFKSLVSWRTAENCWRWNEVATASWGSSGRGKEVEDCIVLRSNDQMRGSGEEKDIVFVDQRSRNDGGVGRVKVHEVEETEADSRESNIWLR